MIKSIFKSAFVFMLMASHFSGHGQDFWQNLNGPDGGFIMALAVNSSDHLFAGTHFYNSGIFRSTNHGVDWVQVNNGMGNLEIACLKVDENNIIYTGTEDGLFKSTDNGDTWTLIGLEGLEVMAIAFNGSGAILAGTWGEGVKISEDGGATWVQCGLGEDGDTDIASGCLAVNSEDVIFAGTGGDGIYRSYDNGQYWNPINNGLGIHYIQSLLVNANDDLIAGTGLGVYISTNDGDDWAYSDDMIYKGLQDMAINQNGFLFAGTACGVFRSVDNCMNWEQLKSGFGNDTLIHPVIIDSEGFIYAGSESGTVYRSIQSTNSVDDPASPSGTDAVLYPVSPNPLKDKARITFFIKEPEVVSLDLLDPNGRIIMTLASRNYPSGSHHVMLSGAGLAEGIYYCRMVAGSSVFTEKLMIK